MDGVYANKVLVLVLVLVLFLRSVFFIFIPCIVCLLIGILYHKLYYISVILYVNTFHHLFIKSVCNLYKALCIDVISIVTIHHTEQILAVRIHIIINEITKKGLNSYIDDIYFGDISFLQGFTGVYLTLNNSMNYISNFGKLIMID
mgnify:CR=1 FL=1